MRLSRRPLPGACGERCDGKRRPSRKGRHRQLLRPRGARREKTVGAEVEEASGPFRFLTAA